MYGILSPLRRWQSGQLQRTVNPSPKGYAGSNPARRTVFIVKVWYLRRIVPLVCMRGVFKSYANTFSRSLFLCFCFSAFGFVTVNA